MWLATYLYTIVISLLLAPVGAKPLGDTYDTSGDDLIVPHHPRFPLRILPLGASITWGQDSTDGNGYREHLRELLEQRSTIVDMVGTVHSGKMSDNENEGHPGARVDQVARSPHPTPLTIDMFLFEEIPNVTIILSTLLLNTNAGADERIRNIVNPQYEALVNSLQERQARIVLADLHPVVKAEELVNGTHPNDKGYEKLAEAWLGAIAEAGRKRLLVKPQNLGDPNINRPPKVGVHGNMGLFDSSKTFRDTHKATLSTVPTTHGNIPVAPTTSLGSTATPTKALPTPEVSCTRPVGQGPLEVGSQRPHCSILGKAPAYVSQILTSVVPQSNAARSNKPFWSGR